MLRLLADADVHGALLKAIRQHDAYLTVVRAQDVGLRTAGDPAILDWSARNDFRVLTHDRSTMVGFANARLQRADQVPGEFAVTRRYAIARVVEDLVLIGECGLPGEFENRVVFLPLGR